MDAGDALAAADELDERGAARVGRRLVARLVQEASGRARQEDRVGYCFRFSVVKTAGIP